MSEVKFMKWCIDCWATGKVDWIDHARGERRPMPQKFDHLFRITDRMRDKQIEIIESIKSEICLDTDVECSTCEGKGYIGYLDWDYTKKIITSEDYFDQIGYRLVSDNGKLFLAEKIEFTFKNFLKWASEELTNPKWINSLGGKTHFTVTMIFDSGQFFKIDYGQRGKTGFMPLDQVRVIWDRYISLGNRKHVTGEYTDPKFRETPNRILAPYVAAVIREFKNDINPSFYP